MVRENGWKMERQQREPGRVESIDVIGEVDGEVGLACLFDEG